MVTEVMPMDGNWWFDCRDEGCDGGDQDSGVN